MKAVAIGFFLALSSLAHAKEAAVVLPEVKIEDSAAEELRATPGSTQQVSKQDLKQQMPLSTGDALKLTPGIIVNAEDPMGLRQNIGFRGLNPSRSRAILTLEDGMPVSLAPYSEPEMYYAPSIDRMERIDILKGSGQILYGPQTIGGVLNYITPKPPEEFTLNSQVRAGSYGYYLGQVSAGDTVGQVGYLVSVLHQRFEGPRNLDMARTDVNGKLLLKFSETHTLTVKLDVFNEGSAATYIGLTTLQYQNNPNANYAIHDYFGINRYSASLTHSFLVNDHLHLETKLYAYETQRHWRRQDYERRFTAGTDYERIIDGNGNNILGQTTYPADGSIVFFKNSTGNRNRDFKVAGIEPRATLNYSVLGIDNELQAGTRFHVEQAREHRINGNYYAANSGVIANDEERYGYALALYAMNKIMLLDQRLQISPGIRFESLWRTRTTYENGYQRGSDYFDAFIPGLGVSYQVLEPLTLFAGVHRGFAPPRVKDSIASTGGSLNFEAEHSWNYELGTRAKWRDYLRTEITGFYLDFSNENMPATEADTSTVDGIGQSGSAQHIGVESSTTFDLAKQQAWSFRLPFTVSYTYLHARLGDDWLLSERGNTVPYAPEHQLSARLAFQHALGFMVEVNGTYLSSQYSDIGNTIEASPDGVLGQIPSRFICDAQVRYTYQPLQMGFFLAAKNLFNTQYIATREPAGIQPGLTRHVFGGIQWTL